MDQTLMPKQDNAAPDAAVPGPLPQQWSEYGDDYILGAEAVVPPREYGPPISSHLPDPSHERRTLRELERRVRSTLSPAFPLEARRRLPGAALLRGYRRFALRTRSLEVDEFGRDQAYCDRVQPVLDFLYQRWLRVELVGAENIPTDQAAILVCNHTGAMPWDATMLMHGLQQQTSSVRPLLEDTVFHLPFAGVLLRRLGAVRACQENAARLLEAGRLVAVFPEGHKAMSKTGDEQHKLQRFGRGGFIKLALRSQSPILPVAIVSRPGKGPWQIPRQLLSKGLFSGRMGLIPPPGRWTIVVGEPIDLSSKLPPEAIDNRALVAQEANRIRTQVSAMIEHSLS